MGRVFIGRIRGGSAPILEAFFAAEPSQASLSRSLPKKMRSVIWLVSIAVLFVVGKSSGGHQLLPRTLNIPQHPNSREARELMFKKHPDSWQARGLTFKKHPDSWEARGLTFKKHPDPTNDSWFLGASRRLGVIFDVLLLLRIVFDLDFLAINLLCVFKNLYELNINKNAFSGASPLLEAVFYVLLLLGVVFVPDMLTTNFS